jgi:hypothetical protein
MVATMKQGVDQSQLQQTWMGLSGEWVEKGLVPQKIYQTDEYVNFISFFFEKSPPSLLMHLVNRITNAKRWF